MVMKYDVFIWSEIHKKLELFLQNPSATTVNIFACEEWEVHPYWQNYPYYPQLENFSATNQLNMIFGCFDTLQHRNKIVKPKNTNLYYWETHWITHTYQSLLKVKYPQPTMIAKPYMSLNHQPHTHRCLLIDHLQKNQLLADGEVSWHFPDVDYQWQYWQPKKMILDAEYTKQLNSYNTLPDGFSTTFMSIVAESNMAVHFVTEKTWMNVFFKRPFLIFGPAGINNIIKKLGFEIYDEIFDYEFDKITDDQTRCDMMLENIHRIMHEDFAKLRTVIRDKLDHNFNLANRLALDRNMWPEPVADLYDRYQTDNTIDQAYRRWLEL